MTDPFDPDDPDDPEMNEQELREQLRRTAEASAVDRGQIDLPAVLDRARAKRAARIAVVGAAAAIVAVLAVTAATISALAPRVPAVMIADGGSSEQPPSNQSTEPPISEPAIGIGQAPAEKINLCGGELAEIAPAASGLTTTVELPTRAPATGGTVEGSVTLTNAGTKAVSGTTGVRPVITVSRDGITVWHSNGPVIAMAAVVALKPGESVEYPASFDAVSCSVEDDLAEGFRADLPPLAAGEYQVSAILSFVPGTAQAGESETVTGAATTIRLE